MDEGQNPQNTYIAGDAVSLSFEFEHEMNLDNLTVKFVNTSAQSEVELEGNPYWDSHTQTSTVEVVGYVYGDTAPGQYDLNHISVQTEGGRNVIMDNVPVVSFWVEREPRTAPRFIRLLEE